MTDEEFDEYLKRPDRIIHSVFVFRNGMVAVCDQNGFQMPEYQGRWYRMKDKIKKDAGPNVHWYTRPE